LYIDGEMTAAEMQHRLAVVVAGFAREVAPEYFRILSADVTKRGLPDLATPDGQRAFDDAIGDAELAILDNISTLCRSGKENEAEGWQAVQDWALSHPVLDALSFSCSTRAKVAISAARRSERTCWIV
jgi:hypothetical protein